MYPELFDHESFTSRASVKQAVGRTHIRKDEGSNKIRYEPDFIRLDVIVENGSFNNYVY